MRSAIYEGRVRHRRFVPVAHAFQYSLFMMYLDLDELPILFERCRLWSNEGHALARFRRRDHLKNHAPPARDLQAAVRDLVAERTGVRPSGPIRLLTHLEYFRYRFNPVSFYFCFDRDDQRVTTVVAEVNNTPWGEQHCYVLPESQNRASGDRRHFEFDKEFHISPFMGMDMWYAWYFTQPAAQLGIHMENRRGSAKHFDATMTLRRREITSTALNAVLLKYPFMTLKVIAAIHWQALRLWLRRCPYYPHPKTTLREGQGAGTC